MNRRGSVAIVVALIIVVVLAAAGGVWYWKAHESPTNIQQPQNTNTTPTTSTYQNTDYGISFEYPSELTLKSGNAANGDYGFYTQYYDPDTVSLVTVEIPPSLYPDTNLNGAYFNLSVDRQLSQSQCLALTSQPGPNHGGGTINIGGVTFNWTRAASAAAGTDEYTENYSGYTNGTCYEFNIGDSTDNDISPTGTKMSGTANDIPILEGVLSSVKFSGSAASSNSIATATSGVSASGTIINPNSLTLNTTNWSVCKNTQYNYEIKYPPGWTTWENGQNWYPDPKVTCDGQQVTFSPSTPDVERVDITVYPSQSNSLLTSPFTADQTVDDVYAAGSSSYGQTFQFGVINGERALWVRNYNGQLIGIDSSALVHHGNAFYQIDYSEGNSTSSQMGENEIDFQAMAESLEF